MTEAPPAPTEFGFYHLQRSTLEAALARLLPRVLEQGLRAVVLAGSEERVEALNVSLWTSPPDSFLPHGGTRDGSADRQPIFLTTEEVNPNGATVLVLTDGVDPTYADRFDRCLDLFDGNDPEAVAAARQRWQRRKAQGHALAYWQQTDGGRWERKA